MVFYAIRPVATVRLQVDRWQLINIGCQVAAIVGVAALVGPIGLAYLVVSVVIAGSIIHPLAGHFISEHFVNTPGQETYSYYGPLNAVTFNVGYHNEHHDFPNIPGRRLPELKTLAPDQYDTLHSHRSWMRAPWEFVMRPDVSLYSRVKRRTQERGTRPSI